MILAPKPIDERERLAALHRYDVLDSAPERAYDDIVQLASQICGTPIAFVGFVDSDRVWHKARIDVPVEESPRDTSFCSHTILGEEPMVVPDLAEDPRFADNPTVTDGPRIRFYAGAPLITEDGYAVGTLCALDKVPRELSDSQSDALAALAHQVVAQLELRRLLAVSRSEALTDPLTAIGNRRLLMADFETLLPAATSAEPLHLLLFDLDGFKLYNDSFGHSSGDALLVRLAGKLASALADRGSVYRIGGDEFCALVRGDVAAVESARTAATEALREHAEGLSITTSHGAVRMPDEATTPERALRLADERMYDEKEGRSAGASQTHDVLLRILNERNPEMQGHGKSVARLAVAVGRHLALTAEDLDQLAKAAALHDIGKVAVPDAILNKPGPLTDDEWTLMKAHSLAGERVLAAAPALRQEAELVRSSHERWDGDGYPDGRAGEEIPLSSRIIFVCSAFDAMTSDRPHCAAVMPAEALAEIRRCAGTQFDPIVAAAFGEVLASASAESPVYAGARG